VDAADSIGRPDLGRIAVGAAADLVAVDLGGLHVGVVRDPVDALLSSATMRDVRQVYVAGRQVVRDGAVPGVDEDALLARMQAESEVGWAGVQDYHWTGKPADEAFPRSFRLARADEFAG
jgi:cytosine/adenosine deaminase-related metal-dependent hydrolase